MALLEMLNLALRVWNSFIEPVFLLPVESCFVLQDDVRVSRNTIPYESPFHSVASVSGVQEFSL